MYKRHYVSCGTMTGYTDVVKELDFITGLSMEPFVLAVNADSPYQTLDDLIQAAKADSGKVTLGNAGATATTGVVAYGLNNALESPFNVVSFNGGAELIPAVLGGHCDAGIFSQSEVLANIDGLRPLVFFGEGHSVLAELQDVPNQMCIRDRPWIFQNVSDGSHRQNAVPSSIQNLYKKSIRFYLHIF